MHDTIQGMTRTGNIIHVLVEKQYTEIESLLCMNGSDLESLVMIYQS